MKFSNFGQKFTGDSGIVDLMEDLGQALNVNPDIFFLGGGNPAHIPAFEQVIAEELKRIADSPEHLRKLIGVYQSPGGEEAFIAQLVRYLRVEFGWDIKPSQVALTNGSQSAFFILLNLFSGTDPSGQKKNVVFPMMPEYLGYADQASEAGVFKSFRPKIESIDEHRYKYHVDFDEFSLSDDDALVCTSCPTNPSGNVLSTDELSRLNSLCVEKGIPFVIDCAYGGPFPGVVFDREMVPFFPESIYVVSCSKLGLPGVRMGIVIGPEEIVQQVVKVNTVMSLSNGNLGPALMNALMEREQLKPICQDMILPFYAKQRHFAISCVERYLAGMPYKMHVSEGAFFLWLWFPRLPVSSAVLYENMKRRGVLIMDGSHFFFGLANDWDHAHQCIRLTFCQSEHVVEGGIKMLAEELTRLGVS